MLNLDIRIQALSLVILYNRRSRQASTLSDIAKLLSLKSFNMGWPFYRITEYGQKVLDAKEYIPHDPEGYLAQIKSVCSILSARLIHCDYVFPRCVGLDLVTGG